MLLGINKHSATQQAVIDSDGAALTYGELQLFVHQLSSRVATRSVCFLLLENNAGGVAWTYASMATRSLVPVLLNSKTDADLLQHLYDIYQPSYVCCPKTKADTWMGELVWECYDYALYRTAHTPYALYEELSHLLPTSGSTGSPKLVRHSYANVEASAANTAAFFGLTPTDRPLLVLPLYYTMGLSVMLSHFQAGATLLISSLSMTDRAFWSFMKDRKATSFTGVPYSYEILHCMRFYRMDLPHLTLLTQGGGKMPLQLNQQFAAYCRDTGKRWIATYGQSEGTARMAYLPAEYAIEKCGSIGRAVPNGELFLIDEQGNTIQSPNCEGEMCYRGKNVTLGYAYTSEDLNKGDERQGVLCTGDIAYRDEEGFYYIVGRKGRFLKLFGMRVGLDECEQIIRTSCKVDCACVGTDEKMYIFITSPQDAQRVKDQLVHTTQILASAFEVRVVDQLPKNEVGKIKYACLQSLI